MTLNIKQEIDIKTFLNWEKLFYCNIKNDYTYWINCLLSDENWKKKLIQIWDGILVDIEKILEIPSWIKVIEATISDYIQQFSRILIDKQTIFTTKQWFKVVKLGESKNDFIEAEVIEGEILNWTVTMWWFINKNNEFWYFDEQNNFIIYNSSL